MKPPPVPRPAVPAARPAPRRKPEPPPARRLSPREFGRFKNLLFAARAVVEGLYAGRHASPLKGGSPEFVEYRHYAPGDPVSLIDWKAFARSDRDYVRVTEKETDMNCYVLLDCSASMEYAGLGPRPLRQSKLDYACLLAAALGYLMVKQGDKAGVTLFDEKVRRHIRCGGTFAHLYGMLHQLERCAPAGRTSTARVLRDAYGLYPRKGLLVVISDFYEEPDALFRALGLYTHRRFEVMLLHVLHEDEHRLPALPHARFVDAESGAHITCRPQELRREYDRRIGAFIETLRRQSAARGIDYQFMTTAAPYDRVLRRYLVRRARIRA